MVIPEGLGPPGLRGRLNVSLYGTRRASFLWRETAAKGMKAAGMERMRSCGQVFFSLTLQAIAAIHGDDIISAGPCAAFEHLDKHLRAQFRVKVTSWIGPGCESLALAFLNREIRHHPGLGYSWHPNPRHVDEVVEELGLTQAKPVATPSVKDGGPAIRGADDLLDTAAVSQFMRCTGKLIYYCLDRFDIRLFAVRQLAQALKARTVRDQMRLKHLWKYLLGTREWCLEYPLQAAPRRVTGYPDLDWATCKITRRSVSSGVILHGSHFISTWVSGQSVVALSSGEKEYYALCHLVAELLFVVYVFREAGLKEDDSTVAKGMAGWTGSGSVKHIKIRHLWLQEVVREKKVALEKWPTADNPADLGTKILMGETVRRLSPRVGLVPQPFSQKVVSCVLTILSLLA